MTVYLGNFSLAGAVLVSVLAIVAAAAALILRSERAVQLARWSIFGTPLFFCITSGALVYAFINNDFGLVYVASYSEKALPLGYKIAAFWAGQEGSLLLWALILAILSALAVMGFRNWRGKDYSITLGMLALANAFFSILLMFAANPFQLTPGGAPLDGRGLNPMLQDPGMIAHPPLLFIGYAGFTIPFAIMVGVLVAGRTDNHWLSLIRRWLIFSWLFLTAGIMLGAWWAYVELGWGGYWAWDPVENASLLPWLTATALMHSIMAQQHRGMFKRWNLALIAATFLLCIFGTYITRSGVIQSVHAFPPSLIGQFFFVFLLIITLSSVALFIWKFSALRPEHELDSLVSREGAFLAGNILLVLMTLTVLIGTVFPLLSGWGTFEPVTVKPEFYNKVVAPMGVLLALFMALGPVLPLGRIKSKQIARQLAIPGILALLITAAYGGGSAYGWLAQRDFSNLTNELSWALVQRNFWALVCVFVATLGTLAVIVEFSRTVSARKLNTNDNWLLTALRLVDRDHRRYGGQLTHLGMMLLIIGVAASSLFVTKKQLRLELGQSDTIEQYVIEYESIAEISRENFVAVEATVAVWNRNGKGYHLHPQKRRYNGWADSINTEVAYLSNWHEDIYVSLAGWEDSGQIAVFEVYVNPGMAWIWIGSIVMVLGSAFCILPRLLTIFARQSNSAQTVLAAKYPLHRGRQNEQSVAARGKEVEPVAS